MPLVLTTPQSINETVVSYKINSYAVDVDRREMYLAYSELNSTNMVISEKTLTIVEPDFTGVINAIQSNITTGSDFYTAQKLAFYNAVKVQTAATGSVI